MNIKRDQNGFVSIIVSIIIMTILSLITIGFAQLMSREQRQALDRQLSSQAFYAAESGVNDATVNIAAYPTNSCYAVVPIGLGVENTCTTANPVTQNLRYDNVTPDGNLPKVVRINTVGGNPATLQLLWSPSASTSAPDFRTLAQGIALPPQANWGADTGGLKVFLIPITNGNSRLDLISRMGQLIIIPTGTATVPTTAYSDFSGSNSGLIIQGGCTGTTCRANINVNGLPAGYTDLYMVVSSLYRTNNIEIDATDSAGNSLSFSGEQALIDSTGKTTDVLRRIQVRQSLRADSEITIGALEATDPAGSICKLIQSNPSSTTDTSCGF